MRVLVVSDIHSNILALDAVLTDATDEGELPVDEVWCLGDIVGYGPAPMACVDRLRDLGAVCIIGNHDAGAVGRIDIDRFNPVAAEACRWTGEQLTADARDWLAALPETSHEDSFTLVHGTPADPIWDYLLRYEQAINAWEGLPTSDLLVGHTHIQFATEAGVGANQPGPDGLVVPIGFARLVINPGSVGQPRDGDPRAAYAIYDDEARNVALRRVHYNISATQRAMAEAGLPDPLITRLSAGR